MPINAAILKPFAHLSTFIETGTHTGDGVQAALDAGFNHVISVDLEGPNNDISANRFSGNSRVRLSYGDSRNWLKTMLLGRPRTGCIWLDAHATDGGSGSYSDCPLLGELAAIASSPIKTHTILIDDVRLIGSNALRLDPSTDNYSMWKLLDAIRDVNRNYRCELIHSPLFCYDILACTVQ